MKLRTYIILIIFFLFCLLAYAGFSQNIKIEIPLSAIKIEPVVIRDTIFKEKVVYKTDTIYKVVERIKLDTIYIEKNPGNDLKFSESKLSLQDFINKAIKEKKKGIVDIDSLVIEKGLIINADCQIEGKNTKLIFNLKGANLFTFSNCTARVKGFNIFVKDSTSVAFSTEFKTGNIWDITLRDITVTGGQNAWYSARGGTWNAKLDSVTKWCHVRFDNVNFSTDMVTVAVYSQDAPAVAVHMDNVELRAGRSHAMYFHPNVSIDFNNVRVMATGLKLTSGQGLALSHYSGGGVPGMARYYRMNNVCSDVAPFAVAPSKEIATIKNSNLQIYDMYVEERDIYAENTNFQLSFISGTLINCTGAVRLINKAFIDGGSFSDIQIGNKNIITPSHILISNATIESINYIRPGDVVIANSFISKLNNTVTDAGSKISFNNTVIESLGYGNPQNIIQEIK
ncbi:hypothetical protein [Polluticaenibacter yanchengensis]|uniref:Uncharacterized protein n=1 Tax=Polluticaenibacter yanchengensis TaxID=3014562 RepID=A0ABT4UKF6_9BACT|nr:hypothetical protein [Chitinophagaceae bacterium LY-5]